MKMKYKVWFLAISAGMIAFQFSNCARFFGDLAGDAVFLRGID